LAGAPWRRGNDAHGDTCFPRAEGAASPSLHKGRAVSAYASLGGRAGLPSLPRPCCAGLVQAG